MFFESNHFTYSSNLHKTLKVFAFFRIKTQREFDNFFKHPSFLHILFRSSKQNRKSFKLVSGFVHMSTPIDPLQQQQSPPGGLTQQAYTAHSGHGSVGPVIAVLAVITILGVIAGMIGRLCSGRRIMGHGQYDVEGWVERKCSSCIDGRVDPPPRPPPAPTSYSPGESAPPADSSETAQEIKQEEQSHQPPPETAQS